MASLILLSVGGCSTTSDRIGGGELSLQVGKRYALRREALIVANRGLIDSIENPDYTMQTYPRYPYRTNPLGVLPRGTIIEVRKIELLSHNRFEATGEAMTGEFKRQLTAYNVTKGVTVGPWPRTGIVLINELCGGSCFDARECVRNLTEYAD